MTLWTREGESLEKGRAIDEREKTARGDAVVSNLQNVVTSWIYSARSRGLGNSLEVELTALTDGVNVGVMERELSRRPQEFLS